MKFEDYLEKKENTKTEVLSESKIFINFISLARLYPDDHAYLASLMATAVSKEDMRQAKHLETMIRSIKEKKDKTQ